MKWNTLIITTIVLYVIYYLIIFFFDKFKSKKNDDFKGYQTVDLDFEEEEAEIVYEENFIDKDFDSSSPQSNQLSNKTENIPVIKEKIFQGLPVDKFLKNAKNLALGIEF